MEGGTIISSRAYTCLLPVSIALPMRPQNADRAIIARSTMGTDRHLSPELAELFRREQLLRHAGEELLQEAELLREQYDQIVAQLTAAKPPEKSNASCTGNQRTGL
jgi:hypothetical protein